MGPRARRHSRPGQTFLILVMVWSREEGWPAANTEPITQIATLIGTLTHAWTKLTGQAALGTGRALCAALRARSGLIGFSAVAIEPCGHPRGCRGVLLSNTASSRCAHRCSQQDFKFGLSPISEQVKYRTRAPRQERAETSLHDALMI